MKFKVYRSPEEERNRRRNKESENRLKEQIRRSPELRRWLSLGPNKKAGKRR